MDAFETVESCPIDNDFDGRIGLRVSAIFVIMVGSAIGVFFPVIASRNTFVKMPSWSFFVAKFFGSGVIIATAFIHLLVPGNEALSTECLGGTFAEYPWAFAIALMSLFALFLSELIAYHMIDKKVDKMNNHSHLHFGDESVFVKKGDSDSEDEAAVGLQQPNHHHHHHGEQDLPKTEEQAADAATVAAYGTHYSHALSHQDPEVIGTPAEDQDKENYYGQLLNVFVLEFGILFHSVFIGLTLAVSGEEFTTLYVVLVFHQMFEGFGLGARIATTNFSKKHQWTPWLLCLAFALTTPIAIAVGLGVRETYPPGGRTNLITNGVFDSLSAGILMYTGLVELMAHEFLFSNEFKGEGGFKKMMYAYGIMCVGAALMALLGKWA